MLKTELREKFGFRIEAVFKCFKSSHHSSVENVPSNGIELEHLVHDKIIVRSLITNNEYFNCLSFFKEKRDITSGAASGVAV